MKFCIYFVLLFNLGCSTYSKKQCFGFDWATQGEIQALGGQPRLKSLEHFRKSCEEEHNIKVDSKSFDEGYERGLQEFCTKTKAFAYGKDGKTYYGICPKMKEEDFLDAYNLGLVLSELKRHTSLRSLSQKNTSIPA